MPAHNERFGATAAGSADLKGSAEMPPLRQAAIPLAESGRQRRRENCIEKVYKPERMYSPKTQRTKYYSEKCVIFASR